MFGIVPIATSWVVKAPVVGDPLVELLIHAVPSNVSVIATAFAAVCISVKGELGGVQTLPIAALEQSATVPTPASTFVRSKCTVPAVATNVAKLGIGTGPVIDGPTRFWIVPLVSPLKVPVLGLPGTYELVTLAPVSLKKIPPLFTVALPEKVAVPVTLSAMAGITKAAVLKATKLKRE